MPQILPHVLRSSSIRAGWVREVAGSIAAGTTAAVYPESGYWPQAGQGGCVCSRERRAMTDKAIEAAKQLEELIIDAKQAVIDIREYHENKKYCYWRIYHLRSELNRIVASMGAGIPVTGAWRKK